jgi:PAS domain S-box-containing protein
MSRPVAGAVVVLACIATPADAASIPACAAIDVRTLPAPATCERLFPSAGVQALYAQADERIKQGNLELAKTALGCAAARLASGQDDAARYEWVRRLGVLTYRDDKVDVALGHFECALSMAEARHDRAAMAKQLKNIGGALRRMGDYDGALRALQRGLDMQRADGDPDVGGALANLAELYRETEHPAQAADYYRQALAAFRRRGNQDEAAHMLHGLGKLALDAGDNRAAVVELEAALATYRATRNPIYSLRVYADLTQAAIDGGDFARARRTADAGLDLASTHHLTPPAELQRVAARAERESGSIAAAEARLRKALKSPPISALDAARLEDELAITLEKAGRDAEALAMLRKARDDERERLEAESSRQFGWLRARFEASENERTIARLRQRTLVLWLTAVSALAALFAVSIVFLRRQQRARLIEAANRARYEEMLARYRREADALGNDRDLLQGLLDSRGDALCLLDADGTVLAANRAACPLLGAARDGLTGRPLSDRLSAEDAAALATALERMEDSASQRLVFAAGDARPALHVELMPWEQGDGLVVMRLVPAAEVSATSDADADADAASRSASMDTVATDDGEDARAAFRRALVELMLAVIEAWERSTGRNRIELAERSRIWRINIDDGRLRARAMERYLSLSRLPQNPRWRDVLRLAYYVLGECQLEPAERDDLQRRVDGVLAYTRRSALV